MKKLVSLLLAVIMVLSMSSMAFAAEEPTELTIAVIRRSTDISNSYNERAWVKDAEKALNLKLNFVELLEGSHSEPLAGLLAGDQVDVYFMGMHFDDSIITENTGMFHAITMEEIQTYCPTYYALAEKYVDGWQEYTTWPDGNIYSLMGHNVKQATGLTQGIQYLNYQWLKNLNMEVPTTLDEFYNMLVAFRDQDPNQNGIKDEIPIDFCNSHYASNLMYYAASWGLALGDNAVIKYSVKDGHVVGAVNTPAFREFLEFYHKLGQEGLLNLEGLSQTKEQLDANIDSGKVGVFMAWGPYSSIKSDLKLDYHYFVPVAADGYETKILPNNPNRSNRDGWVITKRAEKTGKVETALKLYDYWCDPTNSLNVQNGPEGLAWEWVDEENLIYKALDMPASQEEAPEYWAEYTEKMKAAGYEHLVGQNFSGSNTVGYLNSAPLFVKAAQYDMSDTTHNTVRRIQSEQAFSEYFSDIVPSLIVPSEISEELTFMTDGLSTYVNGFAAEAVLNGITDESWNAYLNGLETYNYNYYVEYYDKLLNGTLF